MTKFRLAVFNTQPPHLYFGGVERRILEVTKRIASEADVNVYSGTKAGFKTPITLDGVNYVPAKSTDKLFPLDNWTYNRNLTKNPEVFGADIFEIHNNSAYGFPKALEKRSPKKPFIHLIHGPLMDEYEQGLKNEHQTLRVKLANKFMKHQAKQEEAMAKKASLIVAVSKYSRDKILEHYDVEEAKIRIIPNGVDVEKFKPTEAAASKRQFNLGDEPTVLFVGSLVPRKGLPYLVEAAKKIVKQKANTKFVIVGDGPLRKQLDESLNNAGLMGNFVFLGNLKENQLSAVYGTADVFVLPSIQEGQGIVLLEAQACGKPVVAFGEGGVYEAVRDKETGFLVDLGNSEGLADNLLKLLGDDGLRQKMGTAGRRFVTENFTWDLCAQRMLSVYREQLAI
jgi:glycosyltransferase involved in cell wall biosynthesis